MNDRPYRPRHATGILERSLQASPVVVLMGAPRQTGKTTLLVRSAPCLVLDEVQRERDLLLAIKRAVDEERPRRPGRFLLTGSANLLLMERISETLAGRATYVTLWPLSRRERLGLGGVGSGAR